MLLATAEPPCLPQRTCVTEFPASWTEKLLCNITFISMARFARPSLSRSSDVILHASNVRDPIRMARESGLELHRTSNVRRSLRHAASFLAGSLNNFPSRPMSSLVESTPGLAASNTIHECQCSHKPKYRGSRESPYPQSLSG